MSNPSTFAPSFSLADMDMRARDIFRDVVEGYLETGLPVGSKTLALSGGRSLSPATIRSVMAELSRYGLLTSAHASAGRVPTQAGLRLFVDGLLEIGDIGKAERNTVEAKLAAAGQDPEALMQNASAMLAGLTGGAGLVLAPLSGTQERALRHVEFVNLDGDQALVVLVHEDGAVENRIMARPAGLLPSSLERAGNFLSARLKGRRLSEAREDVLAEIAAGEAQIDVAAATLIKKGLAEWSEPEDRQRRSLIVRGQSHLLDNLEARTDVERIRQLFDDLERKEELIDLMDRTEDADGVKIFIGSENPLFSLSGSSVVIAPYRDQQSNILGALGVIGPTRLNYARVIPMMDYTAQLLGRLLHR
ncbi:heat-inducible transcription repressor HrcA [Litorimonas cladophorae]|uniref:Heat-inducible transcription repressor HrcA n=1 Tax=Litorimonas cladophorae TaxID=1220491 RepID=A0A918NI39_9PROT|nr:heat-inducible transcriptional repressor HrcA [Litorimonas cladophorae]GGX74719.1 heat-inducible transcription repressor HrcA [Litorimonas cladophorae]